MHDHNHHNRANGASGPGHHGRGFRALLADLFRPHSHDPADAVDGALAGSAEGIRAVKWSLVVLGATALLQLVVVAFSGSIGLLADTVHNLGDALTALPLWLAFSVSRRPANARYTYGYGRAEDVAGVFIVLVIAATAAFAGYESIRRLLNPPPVTHLEWVAAAAVVGFIGNEIVSQYRIRAGRRIGSAALVADGYHARADGLTSLAVLFGAVGVWAGFERADPFVGLAVTAVILFLLKSAVVAIWHRLMDAVSPDLVASAEKAAIAVEGVVGVTRVRPRWIGHTMHAEVEITVDRDLSVAHAHDLSESVRHAMTHAVPKLTSVNVHIDPCEHNRPNPNSRSNDYQNRALTA